MLERNGFLPDLESVPRRVLRKSKVLVLNYPNNPTGASATPEFFARVVAFAKENRLVVIHDAAYAALVFEGKPLSFLATPGAKEVGIELHSTSKSFNMTGWRCGFVAGNEMLVRAYGDIKDNTDSGQFLAIQHAAAYCFDHPEITEKIAAKYSRRMIGTGRACCRNAGSRPPNRKVRFSSTSKLPKPRRRREGKTAWNSKNAEEVSQWLIAEKLISTVPWDDAGAYLRFSVTFAAKDRRMRIGCCGKSATRLGEVQVRVLRLLREGSRNIRPGSSSRPPCLTGRRPNP